jgi:hypothetical protein
VSSPIRGRVVTLLKSLNKVLLFEFQLRAHQCRCLFAFLLFIINMYTFYYLDLFVACRCLLFVAMTGDVLRLKDSKVNLF